MPFAPFWEEDSDVLVDDIVGSDIPAQLIVFNDHHNTFDWVVKCFMDVLRYPFEQAEQLSIIIHFKGKASVKSGKKPDLLPLRAALIDKGLSAVVEEIY